MERRVRRDDLGELFPRLACRDVGVAAEQSVDLGEIRRRHVPAGVVVLVIQSGSKKSS
jgi:hypothetical protein